MRKAGIIAGRELRTMMREKSFIIVLIFEALLVSSSAFLGVGYGILSSPESSDFLKGTRNVIYAGLVTDTKKEFALPLQGAGIAYYAYNNLSAAESDFNAGLLDAILIGGVDLRRDPSVMTVYLPSNTPKIGIIRLALKRFFLDVEERLRAVKMLVHTPDLKLIRYEDGASPPAAQNFEVFLVFTIPLLFFMPAIMAGSLIIDGLTEDMESGRLINLLAAPLDYATVVSGKCLGSLAATLPHCVIWLLVLSFTDYAPQSPIAMFLAFTLYSVFFILAGAIISLHFRRNRPSQMAFTLVSVGAIVLMSPSVNVEPALIRMSPAYLFTNMALGSGIADFAVQLLSVLALDTALFFALLKKSQALRNP
jgi:ABC-2 type transport system permease protein